MARSLLLSLSLALLSIASISPASGQVSIATPFTPPPASAGNTPSPSNAEVNSQWATLLGSALYYYDEQRAGSLPDGYRVSWRNTSVLDDGKDVGLNLSGGYFDAGNFIKATFPLSWVLTQVAMSGMMYGSGYDGAQQTPYLDRMLRGGLDWLLEASSKSGTLVCQVGQVNDYYWGGDEGIPTPRDSFSITAQQPGTDAFAAAASALAAGALLYSGQPLPVQASPARNGTAASLRDRAYSARLLERAEALFDLARTSTPQQVYQKANKNLAQAYPSTDFQDELCVGASLLAMATANQSYSDYAMSTYDAAQYPLPNNNLNGVLNWDQKGPLVPVLMAQLALSRPSLPGLNLTRYQADAEHWLDPLVAGNLPLTYKTSAGLQWFKGDSDQSSLNPSLNAVSLLHTYSGLASSPAKTSSYLSFAQGQIDYALGKNPMNTVYVVGAHPNSATNPHSALASGGNSLSTIDTVPAVEAYVLYGAVVGGPDNEDRYFDVRSDYTQTEPALDTVSPLVFIAAAMCANQTAADPFFVGLTTPRVIPSPSEGGGLSQGAKIAIAVIVIVAFFSLVIGLSIWQRDRLRSWWRRRKIGL